MAQVVKGWNGVSKVPGLSPDEDKNEKKTHLPIRKKKMIS